MRATGNEIDIDQILDFRRAVPATKNAAGVTGRVGKCAGKGGRSAADRGEVGRNIGARLQTDQAEADKQIAQAKAEERRAMAVAKEQEMQAYTQEMQAKVVEAQAEVPLALAQALREGKLGVMDYYNMKNIMADTEMRNAVAQAGVPKTQSVPTGQDSHHDDRGPAGK